MQGRGRVARFNAWGETHPWGFAAVLATVSASGVPLGSAVKGEWATAAFLYAVGWLLIFVVGGFVRSWVVRKRGRTIDRYRLSGRGFVALMLPVLALFAIARFVLEGGARIALAVAAFVLFWAALIYLNRRFAKRNANPS